MACFAGGLFNILTKTSYLLVLKPHQEERSQKRKGCRKFYSLTPDQHQALAKVRLKHLKHTHPFLDPGEDRDKQQSLKEKGVPISPPLSPHGICP